MSAGMREIVEQPTYLIRQTRDIVRIEQKTGIANCFR